MRAQRFIGLDTETTGTDVEQHALIQVGVYDPESGDVFRSDIRPPLPYAIDPEAMEVNRFTVERIEAASPAQAVDDALVGWLASHGLDGHLAHAVGFNVAGFDMPFIKRFLPRSYRVLSYRTIDLNAVLFSLAETRRCGSYEDLKHAAKAYGATRVKGKEGSYGWHDAAFDAVASYFAWFYLLALIQRGLP